MNLNDVPTTCAVCKMPFGQEAERFFTSDITNRKTYTVCLKCYRGSVVKDVLNFGKSKPTKEQTMPEKIDFLTWWNTIPSEYTQQRAPAIIHALLSECVDAKTMANIFMNWTPEYQVEFFQNCWERFTQHPSPISGTYQQELAKAFLSNPDALDYVRGVLFGAIGLKIPENIAPTFSKEQLSEIRSRLGGEIETFEQKLGRWLEEARQEVRKIGGTPE